MNAAKQVIIFCILFTGGEYLGADAFSANFHNGAPNQSKQILDLLFLTANRQPMFADPRNMFYDYRWKQDSKNKREKRSFINDDLTNRATSMTSSTTTTTSTIPPPPSS